MTKRQFDIFIRMLEALRLELVEINGWLALEQGYSPGDGPTYPRPSEEYAQIALDLLDREGKEEA